MTEAVSYKSGCLKNDVLLLKSHMHTISMSVLLIFITTVSRTIPPIECRQFKNISIDFSFQLMSFLLVLCILAKMKKEVRNQKKNIRTHAKQNILFGMRRR